MTSLKKRYLLPGMGTGLLLLVLAVNFKSAPTLSPNHDSAKYVDVMSLTRQVIAPELSGFGRVAPKHIWQAVAEVSGKLIYRNPLLETGRMLPADTKLLEIDPLEYQLQQAQALANLNASKAQLTQLVQRQQNLNSSLIIEQQKRLLSEQEHQRKQSLNKKSLVSKSELESQKLSLLAQTKLVEDIENSLKLIPDDRKVTLAQISVDTAKLKDTERRLKNTQVTLPFDARIAVVNIEKEQVVTTGSVMLTAYALDTVEIKAEMALQDIRTLIKSVHRLPQAEQRQLPAVELLGLTASVTFSAGNEEFSWPAKVTRIAETVNPSNATVGLYLEVAQDFHSLDLLKKPPLTQGMFVKAHVSGATDQYAVVPEQAIHESQLYEITRDNKLKKHTVEVLFRNNDQVAIKTDLATGTKLVLNDLIPAIEGMSLKRVKPDTVEAQQ